MVTNSINDVGLKHIWDKIIALLSNKVNKEIGKGLSTNDYTTAEKSKLAGIEDGAQVNTVNSDDISGSKTVTGNPLTITDGSETYAEELSVDLEPIQSGSGTPSPSNVRPIQGYDIVSVDRTGKNLFDKSAIGTTNAYLRNDGGTQQPSSGSEWRISTYIRVLAGEKYTISNMNTTANAPSVCWYDENKNYISGQSYSGNSQITITMPSNAYYIRFSVILSLIDTAQVEEGQTATTFEPFNAQQISLQLGNKNLLPMTVEGIKAANTTGTWSGNVYTLNNVTFTVLTDGNGCVTGIKANASTAASANTTFYLGEINKGDGDKYINGMPATGSGSTFSMAVCVPGGSAFSGRLTEVYGTGDTSFNGDSDSRREFMVIGIVSGYTPSNLVFKPMLRKASVVDSTFSPYNPTLGGMVYGGNLTLNADGSAVFVGDRVCLNGGWEHYSGSNGYKAYRIFNVPARSKQISSTSDLMNDCISEYGVFSSAALNKNIIEPPYSEHPTIAYLALKDDLSAANVQLSYKIDTPFTIHLSAEQLQLLQGTNNLWSNAGDVALKYQPDNVIAEPKADVQRLRDDVDDRLVGNTCRNLLNLPDGTYTDNGVTADVSKGIVTLSGTAGSSRQAVITFASIIYLESEEEYILNGCAAGGSSSKYYIQQNYYDESNTAVAAREYGTEETHFTPKQTKYSTFYIVVAANVNVDNVVLKPMIRRAGITNSAFEEYYPSNRELWEMIKALQNS